MKKYIIAGVALYVFICVLWVIIDDTKASRAGRKGESDVKKVLKRLPKGEYTILNDIMVETSYGTTSQIDHILVSRYGIFPVETKNYFGMVSGFEDDNVWVHDAIKKKYNFYNPIKQNESHVKALKDVLGIKENYMYYPIVTFNDDCILNVISNRPVVHVRNLQATVEDYYSKKLTEEQVKDCVRILKERNITSLSARKAHKKRIENMPLPKNEKAIIEHI